MVETTLCLLLKQDQILLAMKKRGFGAGHWNGCGGKVKLGEDIKSAGIREMREEIGVTAEAADLIPAGRLFFYFRNKPDWDQSMDIFRITKWTGTPSESEEMRPQWFNLDDIPYDTMWPDDRFWLPKFLKGEKIAGECYFDETGKIIEKFLLF